MPNDDHQPARTAMRRSDRAITDEAWIETFLSYAPIGVLATAHDNQPFINSNLFVYDKARHAIYIHTAKVGRTRANIEHNPQVCFSIMSMGRLLPAAEALEFSVEYAAVVAFGQCQIVDDAAEATMALQQLLDKYAPHLKAGEDYRPPVKEELKRTTVLRLDIEALTAKQKLAEANFADAYRYEDVVTDMPTFPVAPSTPDEAAD